MIRRATDSPENCCCHGDQVTVADGMGFKTPFNDEIRVFDFSGFILNPKGLNTLADEFVGILFFRIGKTGPSFPFHQ